VSPARAEDAGGPPAGTTTMTTQRDLKRLVRERAARTGESYTTARRHVLAKAGPSGAPTPGALPGYPGFGGGLHRESTLLAHLLNQAGHIAPHTGAPCSETTLCGLAGGIGFLYAVFEYRGLPPIVTIVAQHHPESWAPAALGRLGVPFEVRHSTGAKAAEADLRALLAAGRPVHCVVDRGGLPWHPSATALATDPYPVVVAGRRDDRYLLDDEAVRPHEIASGDFLSAWSGHRKGRHQRLVIGLAEGTVDLAAAMRAAIRTTVAHLTGPVLGNAFDVNMGFSGMAKLAAQLRDERTSKGWARRFSAPGALTLGLRRLYECLELEYTAPGATRPLYAGFLDEAAAVLGEPRLTRAAALFREAAQEWSAVADRAIRAAGPVGDLLEQQLFRQLTGAGPEELSEIAERIAAVGVADPRAGDPALLVELADGVQAACAAETAAVELMRL
jgi:hypothetical protein